ncbi:MAG TPA: ABC transporter substrate-binding protein [Thermoleophilaceae bacterium]|nr:ABC transporter substrate-binding protein [Thermoleophilaceae bacterium]
MRGNARLIWLAVLAAVALALAACGRDDEEGGGDPGIDDESIKLGGSYPFSGPASAYRSIAVGARAHFKSVNAEGGVDGRKIEFITLDDAYEPPRAVQNARRLIQQEEVFALFNTLGTPNNAAIWDFVNEQEVPHLYVATGASLWGADIESHPWTTGWQPDYVTESQVYADYLEKEKPQAKVAVLYQNDAFGEDLLNGFKDAIDGTDIEIVAEESYEVTDPTVSSQMSKLASSDADTFLNITTPKFSAQAIAAQAKLGWKVLHILNNVGASKKLVLEPVGLENAQGIVSTSYFMDPEDPQWADDPAMAEYKEAMERFEPRADPEDPFHVYGWAVANTMVRALEGMEEPTREALMDSVRNMDEEIPILLPGIELKMDGSNDTYPIEAMQIMRFEGENWKLQGDVIQAPH